VRPCLSDEAIEYMFTHLALLLFVLLISLHTPHLTNSLALPLHSITSKYRPSLPLPVHLSTTYRPSERQTRTPRPEARKRKTTSSHQFSTLVLSQIYLSISWLVPHTTRKYPSLRVWKLYVRIIVQDGHFYIASYHCRPFCLLSRLRAVVSVHFVGECGRTS